MNNNNHYLAEESIGKLLMKFSVPCIMSLLVSALYNVVDQIFIGRGIGYLGNGATNVVFPITIITLALALLIGDGCAAYLSLCLGRKDTERAHHAVGNAIVLVVIVSILMTVFFIVVRDPMLNAFGATENNVEYAREYFNIIVLGVPFYMFGATVNSIVRADGSPAFAMITTLLGCITNIIFDPLAIFVWKMGMTGAALATIAGQILTAVLLIGYLFHTKSVKLHAKSFVPSFNLSGKFLSLGVSSLLTQVSIVVIMIVMNTTLVRYGAMSKYGADIPMTVVGIVMKVFQIIIAIVVGIAVGAQPIIGFNYGAGLNGRVKKVFSTMMKAEIIVGIIAMIVVEVFPLQVIGIFGSEDALYNEFAVLAFRIYLGTIILCILQKASAIFLQAMGKPVQAMALSLLRDFVISVPAVLILPMFFGVTGTLWSAPIADVISIVVVIVLVRKLLKELGDEEETAVPVMEAEFEA